MKYMLNASQTHITALFTHCVKWSSCPTGEHSTKTGSFTQNTLLQVENCNWWGKLTRCSSQLTHICTDCI